jgi:hypothetical protein
MKRLSVFSTIIRLILVAVVCNIAASASTVFNFDSDTLGTPTVFTDTVNGLSATFSSNGDPGGFVVYPTIFDTLTGNVLGSPGPAGLDNLTLNVGFSQDISAVTFNFATADFITPSPLTLNAYENSNLVGSVSATGMYLSGFSFPEGEIAFSGSNFNSPVISSTALDFAVDNITVNPVPEPGTSSLLAIATLALGKPWLRYRFGNRAIKP